MAEVDVLRSVIGMLLSFCGLAIPSGWLFARWQTGRLKEKTIEASKAQMDLITEKSDHQITKNALTVADTSLNLVKTERNTLRQQNFGQQEQIDRLYTRISDAETDFEESIKDITKSFDEKMKAMSKDFQAKFNALNHENDQFKKTLKLRNDHITKLESDYEKAQKELLDSQSKELKLTLDNKNLVKANKKLIERLETLEKELTAYKDRTERIEKRIGTGELKAIDAKDLPNDMQ